MIEFDESWKGWEIYRKIFEFSQKHGYGISQSELADYFGVVNQTISYYIKILIEKEYLWRDTNHVRNIEMGEREPPSFVLNNNF